MDFVNKFEKALRKRHHSLMTEIAKIEHLIDAFEKGAKRGAKRMGSGKDIGGRPQTNLDSTKAEVGREEKITLSRGCRSFRA